MTTDFAKRVAVLADEAASVYALGRKLGLPRSTLDSYVTGNREPKLSHLISIAKGAGVRLEWLATGEGPMRAEGSETMTQMTSKLGSLELHQKLGQQTDNKREILEIYKISELGADVQDPARILDVDRAGLAAPSSAGQQPLNHLPLRTMPAPPPPRMIPVIGFASCGLQSWFSDCQEMGEVPATLDLVGPRGFAVKAVGNSMKPEGIRPGYLCYCAPGRPPGRRDAVYVRRTDGARTLKIFVGLTDKGWYRLLGWLDPEPDGSQKPFFEELSPHFVAEIAPVLYVRRSL